MLINVINKKNLFFIKKKDKYLKKLDGVSVVINRKISSESIIAVGKLLYECGRVSIGVCRFFIEHPTLSIFLIQGTKGVFGMKNINALKWLPRVGRVGVGGTAGYEVASVKHQMGVHEILLETLKKDNVLGSVIESTKDMVDSNVKEQVAVAATSGLIAVSTGVVEPSVISTAMLMPYDAVKTVGKYGIMAAGTGGGLGGISLGITGLMLGSKYLAPDLFNKSMELPSKFIKKINELNIEKNIVEMRTESTGNMIEVLTDKIDINKSKLEVISEGFTQVIQSKKPIGIRCIFDDVIENYTVMEQAHINEMVNFKILPDKHPVEVILNDQNFIEKLLIKDHIIKNSDHFVSKEIVEVIFLSEEEVGKILQTNKNLFLNENQVLVQSKVINYIEQQLYENVETVVSTPTEIGYKNPVYETKLIPEEQSVEYVIKTPSEIETAGSNLNKMLKYSNELIKVYIDNYTLTEHLIIIGSVSLITYGCYKLIKKYWKNPEAVIDPSKTD
jgi:hypothetical protein